MMEFLALVEIRYKDGSWERFLSPDPYYVTLAKARAKCEVVACCWLPIKGGQNG